MIVNFFVALSICYFFKKPPKSVDQMVDNIRNP
jgi:hypothetical protein